MWRPLVLHQETHFQTEKRVHNICWKPLEVRVSLVSLQKLPCLHSSHSASATICEQHLQADFSKWGLPSPYCPYLSRPGSAVIQNGIRLSPPKALVGSVDQPPLYHHPFLKNVPTGVELFPWPVEQVTEERDGCPLTHVEFSPTQLLTLGFILDCQEFKGKTLPELPWRWVLRTYSYPHSSQP